MTDRKKLECVLNEALAFRLTLYRSELPDLYKKLIDNQFDDTLKTIEILYELEEKKEN